MGPAVHGAAGRGRPPLPAHCRRSLVRGLLDQPERATQRLLERLIDAQLLEAPRPGRYQFHDLIRLHARQHAPRQQPQPERLAALTRLVGFYTVTTWHIWTLMDPGNSRAAVADPRWTRGGLRFADDRAALAWLEAERANLLAAIAQAAQAAPATPGIPIELPGQLTRALATLFETHGYWQDGVHANQTALEFACRTGDRTGQAHALGDLGFVYTRQGRYEEALTCLRGSLALYRELGDRAGQAEALRDLGDALNAAAQHQQAQAARQHRTATVQHVLAWGGHRVAAGAQAGHLRPTVPRSCRRRSGRCRCR